MSSIWVARIGLSILRCGPQAAGTPVLFCPRQTRQAPGFNVPFHQSPSSRMSTASQQKQKRLQSKTVTGKSAELSIAESCAHFRRFVTDPALINSILKCLSPRGSGTAVPIIECNPGPGVLTQALLDAGHKVFALETNSDFLPSLERLQKTANGQLKVVHCDFFRIDPWSEGLVQPPSMYSSTLMKNLNITEVSWASDVPLKVFLMLGHKRERILLWRQIYSLYEQLSIYRYGRIELNVFITEKQYWKLISRPGDYMKYQALSVLFQVACDIELLHKEPTSTFFTPSKFRNPAVSGGLPDDNLCLVRITPRRNLFSENFTPIDGATFVHMIKQFLAKRKSKLIEKLDNLAPGNSQDLLQSLALPVDIASGSIYPEEYKLLFELMSRSEDFNRSFVLNEICEDIAATSY
ncbi:dimethyladenosine transferase 2, mitochondrial [Bufo bufo]|uniref:dimethyladenosine transferase 2, mitochondrial n=1 Tax=Bufo bufo TaxID=8384 RepID=UPI001ABE5393|nr:dimethyladenosine transferase 2, mitochondrial [Bufo bufo]